MLDLGFSLLYGALKLRSYFGLSDGSEKFGHGTGFIVQGPGTGLALVTARHVLDPQLALPQILGVEYLRVEVNGWNYASSIEQMETFTMSLQAPPVFPEDAQLDIAIVPVEPPLEYKGPPLTSFFESGLIAEESEFEQDIRTGDFIAAPGYAPIEAIQTDRPVLLTGIVSSDPRTTVAVSRTGGSIAKAILYQSLSRSGLSGAPVFATQRGLHLGEGLLGQPHRPLRLIGVNGGGFKDSSQIPLQFSYFTRSSEVLTLLTKLSRRVESD